MSRIAPFPLMKYTRLAHTLIALAVASLIPACGGGGDEDGENFVSVKQFTSGSCGFFITGTGGVVRVISNGTAGNEDIHRGKPGSQIYEPADVFDANLKPDSGRDTAWYVPDAYQNMGISEDVSPVLGGRLVANGNVLSTIDAMIYHMEEGGKRAMLEVWFPTNNNTTSFSEGLAHFFGATVYADLPSVSGNTLALVWTDDSMTRVLMPTASGTSMRIWFDFDSGKCLVQLWGMVAMAYVNSDGIEIEKGSGEGGVFSSVNSSFRKTFN